MYLVLQAKELRRVADNMVQLGKQVHLLLMLEV
jgi:ribosomal protein L17